LVSGQVRYVMPMPPSSRRGFDHSGMSPRWLKTPSTSRVTANSRPRSGVRGHAPATHSRLCGAAYPHERMELRYGRPEGGIT
jgi:hypothetical protein